MNILCIRQKKNPYNPFVTVFYVSRNINSIREKCHLFYKDNFHKNVIITNATMVIDTSL